MDVNPIAKYLNTLKKVGFVNESEIGFLSVYAFLSYLFDHQDELQLTGEDIGDLNAMLHCLRDKSCLLVSVEDFECMVHGVLEGLLLTAGGTVICTAGGTPIRLMSNN